MILELKDIKLSFSGSANEKLNLLKGVNFSVPKGRITALIGGNGSGKTTLFNIISGFQDGYTGDIFFEGENISALPAYKVAKCGIARLFQTKQLIADISIMDNMKICSADNAGEFPFTQLFSPKKVALAERKKELKAIEILTRLFGENNKYLNMLNEKAASLSYGEQRLLNLAKLLMSDAKLLMLDEPSSGVNPQSFEIIAQTIKKMVEITELSVLLVEHNLKFIENLADKAIYLDNGIVQFEGDTQEVLNNPILKDRYIGI